MLSNEREKLIRNLAQLNPEGVLQATDALLQAHVSSDEILTHLHRGMDQVNSSCIAGEYFIADLIMANNIYREAVDRVTSYGRSVRQQSIGKVMMGTVQGDIHELGKNLISIILRNSGFEIVDLGVNVSPERFCAGVLTHAPNLLVLSGTISGSEIMMARTIEAIEQAGIRDCVRIILGGNCIDESHAILIGADAYSRDLVDCLRLCRQFQLGEE